MNLFLDNARLFNEQAVKTLQGTLTPQAKNIPVLIVNDTAYAHVFSHIEDKPEKQIKFYDYPEEITEPELF